LKIKFSQGVVGYSDAFEMWWDL